MKFNLGQEPSEPPSSPLSNGGPGETGQAHTGKGPITGEQTALCPRPLAVGSSEAGLKWCLREPTWH